VARVGVNFIAEALPLYDVEFSDGVKGGKAGAEEVVQGLVLIGVMEREYAT
jgi:hypothetical protein